MASCQGVQVSGTSQMQPVQATFTHNSQLSLEMFPGQGRKPVSGQEPAAMVGQRVAARQLEVCLGGAGELPARLSAGSPVPNGLGESLGFCVLSTGWEVRGRRRPQGLALCCLPVSAFVSLPRPLGASQIPHATPLHPRGGPSLCLTPLHFLAPLPSTPCSSPLKEV